MKGFEGPFFLAATAVVGLLGALLIGAVAGVFYEAYLYFFRGGKKEEENERE